MTTVPPGGLFEYTRRPIFVSASVHIITRKTYMENHLWMDNLKESGVLWNVQVWTDQVYQLKKW
jgi:hypothetical protein